VSVKNDESKWEIISVPRTFAVIGALHNQNEADSLRNFLIKAKDTKNKDIICFARENLLPEYEGCGLGWEPANLDIELIEWFKKESI